MFEFFKKKDNKLISTTNTTVQQNGVTALVVQSALNLTKEIEDRAKQLGNELRKLEESRIGH